MAAGGLASPVSPTYTDFSNGSAPSEYSADHDLPSPLDAVFDSRSSDATPTQQQEEFLAYQQSLPWAEKKQQSQPQIFTPQGYYATGVYNAGHAADEDWRAKEPFPYSPPSGVQRSYSANAVYGYQQQHHHAHFDATPSPTSPPWDATSFHHHQHSSHSPILPHHAQSPVHSHHPSAPAMTYSASLPGTGYHPHHHALHHSASMQHLSSGSSSPLAAPIGRAHSQSLSHHHHAAHHGPQAQLPPHSQHHHGGVDPRFVLGSGTGAGTGSPPRSPSVHSESRSAHSLSPLSNVLGLEDTNLSTAPTSVSAGSYSRSRSAEVGDDENGSADAGEEGEEGDGDSEYVDNGSDSDGEFLPTGVSRRRGRVSERYAPYAYSPSPSGSAGSGYGYPGDYGAAFTGGVPDAMYSYADGPATFSDDGLLPGQRRPRARPSAALPPPIPVPNLTKKSRGRRVPTVQALYAAGASGRGAGAKAVAARLYTCKVPGCGKCFARGEHLKRHIRSIHTYEKPHKCPYPGCGKDFSRHDNLGQHMRVHKDFVGRV
ncbi:hypothetical protein MKEN_00982900 [Mycena kentingensis (nom. inval.)]|nr:hypothetical protein MKEN_00982900 [Mycena kentingensis (nom. inval.)]